ncbi:MAG: outer membrane protein assembly factor BamA [Rhodospirillales bacterium]|nr:outer membrane protein assembly factor BamA [Rhodospirillales bacterium]
MKKFALGFSVLSLTAFLFTLPAFAQQRVEDIKVVGAERLEVDTISSYMNISRGQTVDQVAIDNALHSLFQTGLFADARIRSENGVLTVYVKENPIINQIAFEGNKRIEDDELLAEISLRPRQVFSKTKVQEAVERMGQLYRRQGRFSAVIDPKIIKLDQNRIDLVFEVSEGDITKVRSVRFVGNKRFSDDQLREEISTKETRWYRFITADDRYDPDRVAYDQELLRRFYLNHGYADFNLVSVRSDLSRDEKGFYITYTIEEGERYKFGDVSVDSSISHFESAVLNPEITFQSGQWYNADSVQTSIRNMTNKLGDLQYAFVNVRPSARKHPDTGTIDIALQISETPRVFVERININGNVRTLDKVVRREMELVEGDPFNRTKLADSEQKIKDLGYFESVKVQAKQGSAPDKSVVDIDVAEKSTGELSVGAGFSTNDGALVDFRVRERNFLGRGQDVLAAATLAGQRTEFDFSFTEPYFLNRDLSAGFDLFHITRDLQTESSYDQKKTGGALRMGYPLSKHWRQTLKYRYEDNTIENVDSIASLFIRDQEGTRSTSAISQRLSYEDLDSTLFPTDGVMGWLDTEYAGLGGDAHFISGKLGASYYYPVYDNIVFNLLAEGGAITAVGNENVEINERFFLGGTTLRGFEQAGIGPRDVSTSDALGGNFFYRGTAELSFPVFLPDELGIKGHAFSDFGSLWNIDETSTISNNFQDNSSIRVSAGVGVSWRSPFGPIRVDFGVPILSEDYDQEQRFRFNFGTRF